jgi:hypothetical protein
LHPSDDAALKDCLDPTCKTASSPLAPGPDRRHSAWRPLREAEVVQRLDLIGREHDLKSLLASQLALHADSSDVRRQSLGGLSS